MSPYFASLFLLALQLPIIFAATTGKVIKSADGTTIYADATGDHRKPSLIFLHGFALSGVVFDRLFTNKKLLSNFYLVRYDMRGHGRSGKPTSPEAHASLRYAQDFAAVSSAFSLNKPVFVGWSLGAAVITDIVANLNPLRIAGAVAISGPPGFNGDILPKIATPALLSILSQFYTNDNVTLGLDIRTQSPETLFKDPNNIPFSLKAEYLGQTVFQSPELSALVSTRPQDPTKLFAVGEAGGLKMQLISGTSDAQIIGQGVLDVFKPHFGKNLAANFLTGGHAIFEDNQSGVADALATFAQSVMKHKH